MPNDKFDLNYPSDLLYTTAQEICSEFKINPELLWQLVEYKQIKVYVPIGKSELNFKSLPKAKNTYYEIGSEDSSRLVSLHHHNCRDNRLFKVFSICGLQSELEYPVPVRVGEVRFNIREINKLILSPSYQDLDRRRTRSVSPFDEYYERSSNIQRNTNSTNRSTESLMKLVALLAIRYASTDQSCMSGGKINASHLENLLLIDAQKYGISELGIKSCRKKIKECLDHLKFSHLETEE